MVLVEVIARRAESITAWMTLYTGHCEPERLEQARECRERG